MFVFFFCPSRVIDTLWSRRVKVANPTATVSIQSVSRGNRTERRVRHVRFGTIIIVIITACSRRSGTVIDAGQRARQIGPKKKKRVYSYKTLGPTVKNARVAPYETRAYTIYRPDSRMLLLASRESSSKRLINLVKSWKHRVYFVKIMFTGISDMGNMRWSNFLARNFD